MNKIFVGTAGWSYQDWIGSFYPHKQSKNFDWLNFYSNYFNAVEINSTYYTYFDPKIFNGWLNKVESNADFLFAVKLHQDFTHKKKYGGINIKAVAEGLDILAEAGRLGGLLIQFPYSFLLNKENGLYLKKIIDLFPAHSKFIELRHKSWMNEKFFEFVSSNKSSLCTIDQPVIGKALEFKPILVGENLYVRLHGRNVKEWKKSTGRMGVKLTYEQQSERYNYFYTPGELIEIENGIKEIFDAAKKIFVILNNHPHGNAVANALEMLHYLNERIKIKVPLTTLNSYPRLSKISL